MVPNFDSPPKMEKGTSGLPNRVDEGLVGSLGLLGLIGLRASGGF